MIKFKTYRFSDLSNELLYDLIKLRLEVFVVEQNCVYQDLDGIDLSATHILGFLNNELVACARIIDKEEVSLGRVIIKKEFRKQNLGYLLLAYSLKETEELYPNKTIVLSSQTYATTFYKKHGFKCVGNEYLEDGIPHIKMLKKE